MSRNRQVGIELGKAARWRKSWQGCGWLPKALALPPLSLR